jgi:hypothetical protein
MPTLTVTVTVVGPNAGADAVRLANTALALAGTTEVRINKEAGK